MLLSVLFFYTKLSPGNFLYCLRVFILTKYLNTAYIPSEIDLTKRFVQKVYKMYTKFIQNIYIVNTLYRKVVQIKNSYGNECTYIKFLHKKCTNCRNLYKVQAEKSLKIEIYVFCMYKQCKNYGKPIQLANRNCPCRCFCI